MPLCISKEWFAITHTLLKRCPGDNVVDIITDTLIIVSQVVQSQLKTDNGCILSGFKYCIQNYGLILKVILFYLNV